MLYHWILEVKLMYNGTVSFCHLSRTKSLPFNCIIYEKSTDIYRYLHIWIFISSSHLARRPQSESWYTACSMLNKFEILYCSLRISHFFCIFVFSHFFFFFQLNYIQPCNESENQWEEGCLICTCINQEQNRTFQYQ